MKTASKLLLKFSQRLFADPGQQQQFIRVLSEPQTFPGAILWQQPRPETLPFAVAEPLSWQPEFSDRVLPPARPGQHPWHQQGYYYCLDFSSVFAASTLLSLPLHPALVIDLCAAPGGKSLFAWRALQPQLLLSNEVIGKRLGMLISNLKRCQVDRAAVLSCDVKILAALMPGTAPVVIVDAPCTGQSLLAKGEQAVGCFHPVTINHNANRQKRILAYAAQLVAPQGYLAYMTCAFSPEENEQVSAWLLKKFPHFQPLEVAPLAAYQSHLTTIPCYRMWPQDGLGAGAFTILFQNTETGEARSLPSDLFSHPGVKWSSNFP